MLNAIGGIRGTIGETMLAGCRKSGRKRGLIRAEDTDGVTGRRFESAEHTRCVGKAPKDKRRIERKGRETVHGDGNSRLSWRQARHHGDARRITGEGVFETSKRVFHGRPIA